MPRAEQAGRLNYFPPLQRLQQVCLAHSGNPLSSTLSEMPLWLLKNQSDAVGPQMLFMSLFPRTPRGAIKL